MTVDREVSALPGGRPGRLLLVARLRQGRNSRIPTQLPRGYQPAFSRKDAEGKARAAAGSIPSTALARPWCARISVSSESERCAGSGQTAGNGSRDRAAAKSTLEGADRSGRAREHSVVLRA
jgi:hypothetical protein